MQWFNLSDNVNLLSFIGAIIIIGLTLIVVGRMFKHMKDKKGALELGEHTWDGIGEQQNNPPFGWMLLFALTTLWVIWYFLWGYPLNSYLRIGEYNNEVAAHNAKFEESFKNLNKEDKIAMGQNIFLVQCSACHGITADGINGKAQNLNIWGSEEGIAYTIKHGSKGLNYTMPEMSKAEDLGIDEKDIPAIAAYVAKEISAIKATKNENLVAQGKELYASYCVSCHQENGTGSLDGDQMAADLTHYGSAAFVSEVLKRGKVGEIGTMPAFNSSVLNDIQKEAVGEFVSSLSRSE